MLTKSIVARIAQAALLIAAFTSSSAAYAQVVLNLTAGWNLLGNSSAAALDVAATFSDATKITTVWTWNKVTGKWAFYAPSMLSSDLTAYTQGKGYEVLNSIAPKEGFWVNASKAVALAGPSDSGAMLVQGDLQQGWNLIGSADNKTASQLNQALDSSLSAAGKAMITAWAWDAPNMKWKFYAPSLEAQAGTVLADYVAAKGYLSLDAVLSTADGIWMNIGAASRGDATTTTTATSTSTTTVATTTTTTQATTTGTGTLTIVKDAVPKDAQDFAFYAFGPNSGSIMPFLLDDDAGAVGADNTLSNSKTFSNLAPGSYSVKEDFFNPVAVTGWDSTGIVCTSSTGMTAGTVGTVDLAIHAFTVDLAAGDNVTCTFTNVKAAATGTGTLTIVKDAQPDDPQAFHFTTVGAGLSAFDLDDDPTNNTLLNTKTFTNLAAGVAYTVTEDTVAGWTVPSIQCIVAVPGSTTTFTDQLNRTFTVNLEAGADVTCTFINLKTQTAATGPFTLTIVKDAQPDDPQAFHFTTAGTGLSDFDLVDNGTPPNSKTFTNLAAGSYSVTEAAMSGWTTSGTGYQGSINCSDTGTGTHSTFTPTSNSVAVHFVDGNIPNVTCTFINVKQAPPTFTAIAAPTLQVSTIAMIPTVLQTSASFTSTAGGNSGTATVSAGPTGVPNDGIFTVASFVNPYPVYSLVGAVATLPSSILLPSGTALSMTSTSLASLAGLTSADFGVWAIKNDVTVPGSQPPVFVMTYSAFAGGTQLTTSMPTGTATYTGKMTGVLANTPIGGSDDVSGTVSLSADFTNGTITGQFTGIANIAGASTLPGTTAFSGSFADISLLSGGAVSGNGFSAAVATTSIPGAGTAIMKGNFYGATASELAGTFTISVPSLGNPGAGLILIGSFGAKQ